MRIAMALTVVAFGVNGVQALSPVLPNDGAMGRHDVAPQRYHSTPQAEATARNSVSEAPRCVSDSDGFFGDTSANGVSLQYYYQVEYDTNVIPKVTNRVLKTIQSKLTDYLLPVLFQRACAETRRMLVETLRHRRLEAVGISAMPDDVIVQGASCSYEPSGDGISCALAFGQASIFAQEGASAEHQGDRAIESIELIMKDGGLDGIAPGVITVSFVNGTHIKGVDPNAMSNTSTDANSGEGGLPGYAIALIIVAVVGVLAVALFLIVRKRQKRARERRANANPGALAFEELSLDGRCRAI